MLFYAFHLFRDAHNKHVNFFQMGCKVIGQSRNLQKVSCPGENWRSLFLPNFLYHNKSVLFQVSYAIGVAKPVSISVFDYGTSTRTSAELEKIVQENFDLRPGVIVR